MKMIGELPRRIRVDHMTPAELAIRDAIRVVEEAGADALLTNAVILLGAAQGKVADFVDRAASRFVCMTCPFCTDSQEECDRHEDDAHPRVPGHGHMAENGVAARLQHFMECGDCGRPLAEHPSAECSRFVEPAAASRTQERAE